MTLSTTVPMVFIETIDDNKDVIFQKQVDLEKYDQLSQADTSWKVMVFPKPDKYEADDEDEVVNIKGL